MFNSIPGTKIRPAFFAAAAASSKPSSVSWSVKAKTERPLSFAEKTSSDGLFSPSDAVE